MRLLKSKWTKWRNGEAGPPRGEAGKPKRLREGRQSGGAFAY